MRVERMYIGKEWTPFQQEWERQGESEGTATITGHAIEADSHNTKVSRFWGSFIWSYGYVKGRLREGHLAQLSGRT